MAVPASRLAIRGPNLSMKPSSVAGGFITGGAGAVSQTSPQNPFNTHPEKGPSTFDIAHSFTLSLAQDLHGQDIDFLRPLGRSGQRTGGSY